MTDEEKKELEKLTKGELVELVGGLRDQKKELEAQAKTKSAEARKVIEAFLSPSAETSAEPMSNDPLKSKAFEKLKNRFK